MSLRTRLRDWWRGYTDADIRSMQAKLSKPHPPGATIEMTRAEMKAVAAGEDYERVMDMGNGLHCTVGRSKR